MKPRRIGSEVDALESRTKRAKSVDPISEP
jgi:hypothetical protein